VPQRQIGKIVRQARNDNSFLAKEYPDLDPRALADIERELQHPATPQPVTLTKKTITSAKDSSCCK
jgi:hypothetical protein